MQNAVVRRRVSHFVVDAQCRRACSVRASGVAWHMLPSKTSQVISGRNKMWTAQLLTASSSSSRSGACGNRGSSALHTAALVEDQTPPPVAQDADEEFGREDPVGCCGSGCVPCVHDYRPRQTVVGLHDLFAPTDPRAPREPTNCCGKGCDPCVMEAYYKRVKRYQTSLVRFGQPWEPGLDVEEGFCVGNRASLINFKGKRAVHMNGLTVDILAEDDRVGRWKVRVVGGQRVLRLPEKKLDILKTEVHETE